MPMSVLAQDDGGGVLSVLPDWVADAPPWVQIVALIVVGLPALGTLIASMVVLVQMIRSKTATTPGGTGSSEAPRESTTTSTPTSTSAPAQQADEKLALISDLVGDLKRRLVLVEQEAAGLRQALDQTEETLAQVRHDLWQVTWQRDQLLAERAPRHRQPPPATSWGSSPG
jgi:hypothetical protein